MVMPLVLSNEYCCWHTCFFFMSFLLISVRALELDASYQKCFGSYLSHTCERNTSIHYKSSISLSCDDLKGIGPLTTTCVLNSSLFLEDNLSIIGEGNLEILPHIWIVCPIKSCSISLNFSGNITLGQNTSLGAGSITVVATSLALDHQSSINTSSLGGPTPAQISGTPTSYDGAGGGHGGRGASCVRENQTNPWGGDVYAWSTLSDLFSYGSKGGSISDCLPNGR